jgi:hypothetical protein
MKRFFTNEFAQAAILAFAAIIAFAFFALTATSCAKTDELSGEKNKLMTINANIDSGTKAEASLVDGTKVYYTENGDDAHHTMSVTWATSDKMFVYDGNANSANFDIFTYAGTDNAKSGKFTGTLASTITNGHQIYAIAQGNESSYYGGSAKINGCGIDVSTTQGSYSLLYNQANELRATSYMYAGATYSGDSIPALTFHNAMGAIRVNLPSDVWRFYQKIRSYSADASICNSAVMEVKGTGTSVYPVWTGQTRFGTREIMNWTGNFSFNQSDYRFYFTMLPQTSCKGLTIVLTPDGLNVSATAVYYYMLTGTTAIESSKYYVIPASAFKTGALLSNETQRGTSDFWYCDQNPQDARLKTYLTAVNGNTARNIVVVAEGFTETPAALQDCNRLQTFINNDCTALSANMFNGCTNLQNVSIDGVTSLPANAFTGCTSLTHLNLTASSMNTIGDNAFSGCTALTTLKIYQRVYNWGVTVFDGVNTGNVDLYVNTGQTGVSGNTITCGSTTYTFKNIYVTL